MNSSELKKAKRDVRREVIALRDAMSAEQRADLSCRIADNVLAMPEVQEARTALCFWSFGSEVDTVPLIEGLVDQGVTVCLPRVDGDIINAYAWKPGDSMSVSSFGVMEPLDGEVISPDQIDLVVVPGVAFDASGNRLGYGGGFYDRYMPSLKPQALKAGICFAIQFRGEPLPAGNFDLAVDALVTEESVLRFSA